MTCPCVQLVQLIFAVKLEPVLVLYHGSLTLTLHKAISVSVKKPVKTHIDKIEGIDR